jgi:hypothetical protein
MAKVKSKANNKYSPRYMTDLAMECDMDVTTFQSWLSETDWINLVVLGWRPQKRLLIPSVVKYIRNSLLKELAEGEDEADNA